MIVWFPNALVIGRCIFQAYTVAWDRSVQRDSNLNRSGNWDFALVAIVACSLIWQKSMLDHLLVYYHRYTLALGLYELNLYSNTVKYLWTLTTCSPGQFFYISHICLNQILFAR